MLFTAVKVVRPVHANAKRHAPYVSVETSHNNYDILWSLWNDLAAPHTDLSLASGHNCTHLDHEEWKKYESESEWVSG